MIIHFKVLGTILQRCTKIIETIVQFCVSNILFKKRKLQMELFLCNFIFNTFIYIFWNFEINIINFKNPKNTFKIVVTTIFVV